MRILSFALFCLFLLSSSVEAVYVPWGDETSVKTELAFNINLVHRLELMINEKKHYTAFDATPKRYIIAISQEQDYNTFRSTYNATPKKTHSPYIEKLFRRETLNTQKNNDDSTALTEYAYTISDATSGQRFNFYVIPRDQFYTLKLDQIDQFNTTLANLIPNISYFGSCRVRIPLRKLRNARKLKIYNDDAPNGQYTASEAIQTYQLATQQLDLPEERFRYLLWQNPSVRGFPFLDYKPTDVFIVESCNLKEFILDGYYLNNTEILNKLFLKPLIVDEKKTTPLLAYYHHLVAKAEIEAGLIDPYKPRKKSSLDPLKWFSSPPDDFLTEDELYILTNLQVNILTEEAFIQHMADFSELVEEKPVIFVSHVNAKGMDGNHLYQRELIDRYIQKGAQQLDQHYFRPGDLFIDYAQKEVLVSRGDINHYKPEFMETIGEEIFTVVQKSLAY